MAVVRYTVEELVKLRESDLVRKPDGLPSIEQWIESTEAGQKKGRGPSSRGDEHGGPGDPGQRQSLFQARHLSRNSSTAPDEIVLGPPKMAFASASAARHQNRLSHHAERSHMPSSADESALAARGSFRPGFPRDRDGERPSEKPNVTNGRRGIREGSDSWTSVRSRRSLGQDDVEGSHKEGDRERSAKNAGPEDGSASGLRRAGQGRGRFEHPWAREDRDGARPTAKQSGWRERDRREDRGGEKGGRVEEDPEWMDAPTRSEKKPVHTQEDFQRWKEQMKAAAATPAEEIGPPLEAAPVDAKAAPVASKPVTPLTLEGGLENMFGLWGDTKRADEGTSQPKAATGKPKSSRFAGFFAPQEEPVSPPHAPTNGVGAQASRPAAGSDANEDREGFQRILQMLGGASITTQTPRPTAPPGLAGLFASDVGDPAGAHFSGSPPAHAGLNRQQPPYRKPSLQHHDPREGVADAYPAGSAYSVEPSTAHAFVGGLPLGGNTTRDGPHGHPFDEIDPRSDATHQPGAKNGNVREGRGPQGMPGHDGRPESNVNRDSEFLLNLMHHPGPMASQGHGTHYPIKPYDPAHHPAFNDNSRPNLHAPKPKGLPPGFFNEGQLTEDELFHLQRREADQPPEYARQSTTYPPPGLYDDHAALAAHRRGAAENPARPQQGNLGIPQNAPPDSMWMKMGMGPQDRIPLPPGFVGNGRQPPGFGGPTPPSYSAGNTPIGPPGLGRGMVGPPPGFPNQIPPPGFFPGPNPPPGFPLGPMMQESMLGGPMGGSGPPRRGQFDMFPDANPNRAVGRGGPTGRGQFGM